MINAVSFGSQQTTQENKKPSVVIPALVGGAAGLAGGYFVPWSKATKYGEDKVDEFLKADDAKADLDKITAEDKQADVKTLKDALEANKNAPEKTETTEKAGTNVIDELFKDNATDTELSKVLAKVEGTPKLEDLQKVVIEGADQPIKNSEDIIKLAKKAAEEMEKDKESFKIITEGPLAAHIKKAADNSVFVQPCKPEVKESFTAGTGAVELNRISLYSSKEKEISAAAKKLKQGQDTTTIPNGKGVIQIKKSDKGVITVESGTMKAKAFTSDGKGAIELSKVKEYAGKNIQKAAGELKNGTETNIVNGETAIQIKKSDKGIVTVESGKIEKVQNVVPDTKIEFKKLEDLTKETEEKRAAFVKNKSIATELGIKAETTDATKVTKEQVEKAFKATTSKASKEVEDAFKNVHSLIKKVSAIRVAGFAAGGMLLAGLLAYAFGGNKEQ